MTSLPPLRVPAGDGELLAVPPLAEVSRRLEANRVRLARQRGEVLHLPRADLRSLARRELLSEARHHLSARGEPLPAGSAPALEAPLLLAGHQPELFHPGVWVKNFVLAGLARRHDAVAVNLLVDNDTVKTTSLAVPAAGPAGLEVQLRPFDRWHGETPWEEYRPDDTARFRSFADETAALLQPLGIEPLLTTFWPEVCRHVLAGPQPGRVGEGFAAARRKVERGWGCHNLELPLSVVCRGEAFAWFAGALLAELPRFVEGYNGCLREHRRRHRLRSRHHPAPDLVADGDWLEAPLWGCRDGRRSRLFARLRGDRLELRGGAEHWPTLPSPRRGPLFVETWRALEAAGFKVRSRALTTTMHARLFLGDLFLHGIGGGKYDELTDAIIRHFWGIEPPDYLVVTATHWLPLPAPRVRDDDWHALQHRLRDLQFNPDRHLAANPPDRLTSLVHQKRTLLAQTPTTRRERRARFRALRAVNADLAPAVAGQRDEVLARLQTTEHQLAQRALAHRRDWAFPLYPAAQLRDALTAVL